MIPVPGSSPVSTLQSTTSAGETCLETSERSGIEGFLALPVNPGSRNEKILDESTDAADLRVKPLSRFAKKVLGSCLVALLVILIVLTCWSSGVFEPGQVQIDFGDAKLHIDKLCRMRPPLSISDVAGDHPTRSKLYHKLLCLSEAIFHMRFGVAESPMGIKCDPNLASKDLELMQTISTRFEPSEICARLLDRSMCTPHKFSSNEICSECSKLASGLRLILLQESIFEVFHRGWLSPRTYWEKNTLVVPFDTILLAFLAYHAAEKDIVKVMEQALVVTESIAVQDLKRPWETIETHAFLLVAENAIRDMNLTPGAVRMSGYQFYWILRIENYCAPRFPHSKRKASDRDYMLELDNILTVLELPKD